jgi:hypothetical protein
MGIGGVYLKVDTKCRANGVFVKDSDGRITRLALCSAWIQ